MSETIHNAPDVSDLFAWLPANPSDIFLHLELTIGDSPDGGHLFSLLVASPAALRKRHHPGSSPPPHALLIHHDYSWQDVLDYIHGLLEKCQAPTWEQSARNLARHLHWEFDNYRP